MLAGRYRLRVRRCRSPLAISPSRRRVAPRYSVMSQRRAWISDSESQVWIDETVLRFSFPFADWISRKLRIWVCSGPAGASSSLLCRVHCAFGQHCAAFWIAARDLAVDVRFSSLFFADG